MNIYLDLDGVLVDFAKGFEEHFGQSAEVTFRELGDDYTWHLIDKIPSFWSSMDPMPDADILWSYVSPYNPSILTKPAASVHNCKQEKLEWVKKYLGDVPIIFSSDKYSYADDSSILIDDKEENILPWEEAGGIGILHTDAASTIEKLKELGL